MLTPGRIPLTEAEGAAIAKLLNKNRGAGTLTRRDPGDSGPVVVHIGKDTWLVDEAGKTRKTRR